MKARHQATDAFPVTRFDNELGSGVGERINNDPSQIPQTLPLQETSTPMGTARLRSRCSLARVNHGTTSEHRFGKTAETGCRARVALLTGRAFFSHLIAEPFASGLTEAFSFAVVAWPIAAAAYWL
jgi:hypothetical protein